MAAAENDLISLLPRRDRSRLLAISESVQLELGAVLCEPGKPTRHVYFPNDCLISLVTAIEGEPWLEVRMVGCEGIQEFLAHMLGVRRVSITSAASDLQRRGLIGYHRGEITVLDRGGLGKAACSCYAADRHAYALTFG